MKLIKKKKPIVDTQILLIIDGFYTTVNLLYPMPSGLVICKLQKKNDPLKHNCNFFQHKKLSFANIYPTKIVCVGSSQIKIEL